MTLQELQNKVDSFKEMTDLIIKDNPGCREVSWQITDVPYRTFDEFRKLLDGVEPTSCGGKLYYFARHAYGSGAQIVIWSLPVKIKTHIEVIEEQLQTETI